MGGRRGGTSDEGHEGKAGGSGGTSNEGHEGKAGGRGTSDEGHEGKESRRSGTGDEGNESEEGDRSTGDESHEGVKRSVTFQWRLQCALLEASSSLWPQAGRAHQALRAEPPTLGR